eukprot:8845297-Heterocapsa_arctica.AAC.1
MAGIGDEPSRAESTVTRLPLQSTGLFPSWLQHSYGLEVAGHASAGPASVGCVPRGCSGSCIADCVHRVDAS